MNSLELNLGLIYSTFFTKENGGQRALGIFDRRKMYERPRGLYRLLRDHNESDDEVSDHESYQRDAFDTLLSGYAMLEIASLCGEIPRSLPSGFIRNALQVLEHSAVRRYYGKIYPTPLVEAFRRRLHGQPILLDSALSMSLGFSRFFDLSRPVEDEGALETFLWFLDDGERDWGEGYKDIEDTLRRIQYPERFAACLAAGSDDDLVSLSVQGLLEFVEFCRQFDEFLQSLEAEVTQDPNLRLVRSAYWHFHSYWFIHLRDKIGSVVLERILPEVALWREQVFIAEPMQANLDWSSIEAEIEKTSAAISRLLNYEAYGSEFAAALRF